MQSKSQKLEKLLSDAQNVVIPYSEEFSLSHKEFAQRMWPSKVRRRNEEYIRWKFRGEKNGPVDGFLLAVVDGKVIGQLGLIPVQLRIGNSIFKAQWACDLMVDTTSRQKGIGSLLLAAGMSRDIVTLGSDPSRLADIAMTRLGFKPLPGPIKMVLPLKLAPISHWKFDGRFRTLVSITTTILQPIWSLRLELINHKRSGKVLHVEYADVFPLIKKKQVSLSHPHILHDMNFLEWRFGQKNSQMECVIAPEGGYAIYEASPKRLIIYDWNSDYSGDFHCLFRHIFDSALQVNAELISVLANTQKEKHFLSRFGFLAMRTPTKVIYYPQISEFAQSNYFHYCLYDSDGNL